MNKMIPMLALALPLLAGCVSATAAESRQAEAYARCSYAPGPDERARCMKTELALIEARDRKEADRAQADHEAAEHRQAVLEASGMSSNDAKQTVDSGLRTPD